MHDWIRPIISSLTNGDRNLYLLSCMTEEEFQRTVEEFLERHDLTPTTFGLWAMNDSRFVWDLRAGRRCFSSTMRRVLDFMAAYEAKQEAKRQRQVAAAATAATAGTKTA